MVLNNYFHNQIRSGLNAKTRFLKLEIENVLSKQMEISNRPTINITRR